MDAADPSGLDGGQGVRKGRLGFGRKSDDHVRRDVHPRHGGSEARDVLEVFRCRVVPSHIAQDRVIA